MTTVVPPLQRSDVSWTGYKDSIVVGKDILELLGTSMYVDPITIYREYTQNAADAIDEGRRLGILSQSTPGRVDINIDAESRTIRIRDNGLGIRPEDFATRLTAFGASPKRGLRARGFRGVGRLAGLGYCQALTFRSRSVGEDKVNELRWDCREMKANLRASDLNGDLRNLVNLIVETRELEGSEWPAHFFEVELRGIVRHRNDCLLNPFEVEGYLSQVAPVPFSPEFGFVDEIISKVNPHVALGDLEIRIGGLDRPVFRPHRNRFEISRGVFDEFTELEFIEVPAVDSGTAGVGWVLHHSYRGALPSQLKIKGLRLRSGNMQVGDDRLLESLFPEQRFNSWCVGEFHIVDERIVSNARRDQYEQNVHYDNVINHISPLARSLSTRCRTSSLKRNWLREFERQNLAAKQTMTVLRQGSLALPQRRELEAEVDDALRAMEKIACREALPTESKKDLKSVLSRTDRQFSKLRGINHRAKPLSKMPRHRSRIYQQLFGLIYKCSSSPGNAKALIDRILRRLA